MIKSVHRMEAAAIPVAEFRAQFVEKQVPLLLGGLQQGWPAREKWSAEYFRSRFGDQQIPVREYGAGGDRPYAARATSFRGYLDYWEKLDGDAGRVPQPNLYMAEWNFVEQCPELLEDFTTPEYFLPDWIDALPPNLQFGRVWIFIGHPGAH